MSPWIDQKSARASASSSVSVGWNPSGSPWSSPLRSHTYLRNVKPHLIKDGIRIICNTENFVPIVVPGLSSSSSGSSSTLRTSMKQESHSSSSSPSSPTLDEIQVRERKDAPNSDISPVPVSNLIDDGSGQPEEIQANKNQIKRKPRWNGETGQILRSRNGCKNSGKIWWMMKFHSREVLTPVLLLKFLQSWLPRDERIWVNTVLILNSLKTEIARSVNGPKLQGPMQKTHGGAVPRADNFGDLTTADQKVLSDNCESRNNHRSAIVVQDLATQWILSYQCKTKTSQETQRSLRKFLEPDRKPKVIYTDNSLEFGKACEDLSWNHCTSTPHRSETNGIAERAVRRVKEGTSAVLLQSGLNESWWADSMECYTYLRNVTDLLSDGKTPYESRFGKPFKGPIIPFGSSLR